MIYLITLLRFVTWKSPVRTSNAKGGELTHRIEYWKENHGSVTHFQKKKSWWIRDFSSESPRFLEMGDPASGDPGQGQGKPDEDNIRVVCRFRPLNEVEERTGSKFVVKFPDDQCASVSVSVFWRNFMISERKILA